MSGGDYDFNEETAKLVYLRDNLIKECELCLNKSEITGEPLPPHISRFTDRYVRMRDEKLLLEKMHEIRDFRQKLDNRRFDLIPEQVNDKDYQRVCQYLQYEEKLDNVGTVFSGLEFPLVDISLTTAGESLATPSSEMALPATQKKSTHVPRGPLRAYK